MEMFKLKLKRIYEPDCTVGILSGNEFRCLTLELPDKGNAQGISCIPAGEYMCDKINSPSLGDCINVANVTNRTFIRIHSGNYTRQILGCILVGDSIKDIDKDGILDVTNSKNTLRALMKLAPDNFLLTIE